MGRGADEHDDTLRARAHLLGEVRVVVDGNELVLGAMANRLVLAMLLLAGGQAVSKERLVEAMWGEEPPDAESALRVAITRLRKRIAPAGWTIASTGSGYRLEGEYWLDTTHLDALEEAMHSDGGGEERFAAASAATALWSGRTLGELADLDAGRRIAARFDGRRGVVRRVLFETATTPADLQRCAAEFAEWCNDDPLDEVAACAYASALAAGGRTTAALRHLAATRDALGEVGLDAGRRLVELELRLLTQTDVPIPAHGGPGAELPPRLAALSGRPLIGRETEFADLDRAWRRALVLGVQAVRVAGPPGVGKSALLAHFSARLRAEGVEVVYAASDLDNQRPLLVAASLMRQLQPSFDEESWTVDAGADGPMARLAVVELAAGMLGRALAARPTLLVVDDIGSIDELSLAVLDLLLERRPTVTAMVAVAERDARTWFRGRAAIVMLGPLSVRALEHWLGGDEGWTAEELHALTGGLPLLVEEALARGPGDVGDLTEVGAALFDRHVGGLTDAALDTITTAALLGNTFAVDEVFAMSRLEPTEVIDHLDAAIRRGLVLDDTGATLSFRHDLFRRAALARWSEFRLARTHAAVLERTSLIASDPLRALRHAEHAGQLLERDTAVRVALGAARQQVAATAYSDARRALQLGACRVGDRPANVAEVELLSLLGTCSAAAGATDVARGAFDAALDGARRLDDVDALVEVFIASSAIGHLGCRRRRAAEMLAVVPRLGELPPQRQAQFLRTLVPICTADDAPELLVELRRRMTALLGDLERPVDRALLLAAIYALVPTDAGLAARLQEVAEIMGRVEGDPWPSTDRFAAVALDALADGELDRAARVIRAAAETARSANDGRAEWLAMGMECTVDFLRGDADAALRAAGAAYRRGIELGTAGAADTCDAQRFAIGWLVGDVAASLDPLRSVVDRPFSFVWRGALALAEAVSGDPARARALLDACVAEVDAQRINFLGVVGIIYAAEAAWLTGHAAFAEASIDVFAARRGDHLRLAGGLMDYGPAGRYVALCSVLLGRRGGTEELIAVAEDRASCPVWQSRAVVDLAAASGGEIPDVRLWRWAATRRRKLT